MHGKIAAVVDGGDCCVGVESTVIALEREDSVRILRPGYVTKEMLETVVPHVTLDKAILHQLQEGQIVRSPGMKYQHYSPHAHVTLIEGRWPEFAAWVQQHAEAGTYALVFDGEGVRNKDFFGLENSLNTNAMIKGSSLLWLIGFIHHQSFAAVVEISKKI